MIALPVPFHGNHPQFNIYVQGQIQELKDIKNLNSNSINALQSDLKGMINSAYENYSKTSENLNDYFRKFN